MRKLLQHKKFIRVVCLLLAMLCMVSVLTPVAEADDMPDDSSFYHMASVLAAYVNKKLASNEDSSGGAIEILKQSGNTGEIATMVGNVGGLLGYADPSDAGEGFFGQLMSQLSGSSSTFSYSSVQNRLITKSGSNGSEYSNNMYYYCQYGYLLAQIGFDSCGSLGSAIFRKIVGGITLLIYVVFSAVEFFFGITIWVLKMTNPFMWVGLGIDRVWSGDDLSGGVATELGTFVGNSIDEGNPLYVIINTLGHFYEVLSNMGWMLVIPILIAALVFSILVGQAGQTGGKVKRFLVRVFAITFCVPLCGSLYTVALNMLSDEWSNGNMTSSYVIASTFVDFESWAKNYRLRIPTSCNPPSSGVNVSSAGRAYFAMDVVAQEYIDAASDSENSDGGVDLLQVGGTPNAVTKSSLQYLAVAVNNMALYGNIFGNSMVVTTDDGGMSDAINWNTNSALKNSSSEKNSSDNVILTTVDLITRYMNGAFYNASDWETLVKAQMSKSAAADDDTFDAMVDMYIKSTSSDKIESDFFDVESGTKDKLFDVWGNGHLTVVDGSDLKNPDGSDFRPSSIQYANSITPRTIVFGNFASTSYDHTLVGSGNTDGANPDYSGGLSTMSLYNYLNSEFTSSGVVVYSSKLASSGYVRKAHYSVNMIGTGVESFVYWVNSMVLLGCLLVLAVIYSLGMMFGGLRRTFDVISAIPLALLGTLNGLMKVLTYTVMLLCEILVSIFLYGLFKEVFMFMSQTVVSQVSYYFSDLTIMIGGNSVPLNILTSGFGTLLVQLIAIVFEVRVTLVAIKYRSVIVRQMEELASRLTQETVSKLTGKNMNSMLPSEAAERASLAHPANMIGMAESGLRAAHQGAMDALGRTPIDDGSDAQQPGDEENKIATGEAALDENGNVAGSEAAQLDGEAAAIDHAMENAGRNLSSLDDASAPGSSNESDSSTINFSDDDVINQMDADGDGNIDTADEAARAESGYVNGINEADAAKDSANAHTSAANAAEAKHDFADAAKERKASADANKDAGDYGAAANDMAKAGMDYEANGDHDKAADAYREAADLAEKAGDTEAAKAAYQKAAEQNDKAGRHGEAANDLAKISSIDEDAAEKAEEQATALRKMADRETNPERKAALEAAARDAESRAEAYHLAAADNAQRMADQREADGDMLGAAEAYDVAARNALASGNAELAGELAEAAAEDYKKAGHDAEAAKAAEAAADAYRRAGDSKSAQKMEDKARELSASAKNSSGKAASLDASAKKFANDGQHSAAGVSYEKAAKAHLAAGDADAAAASFDEAAKAYAAANDFERAENAADEAADAHAAAGDYESAAKSAGMAANMAENKASDSRMPAKDKGAFLEKAAEHHMKEASMLAANGSMTDAAKAEIAAGKSEAEAAQNYAKAGDSEKAAAAGEVAAKYSMNGASGMLDASKAAETADDLPGAARLAGEAAAAANQAAKGYDAAGDKQNAAVARMASAGASKQAASLSAKKASQLSREASGHEANAANLDKQAAEFQAKADEAHRAYQNDESDLTAKATYNQMTASADRARTAAANERSAGQAKREAADAASSAAMSHAQNMRSSANAASRSFGAGSEQGAGAAATSMQAMQASAAACSQMAQSKRAQAANLEAQAASASGSKKAELLESAQSMRQSAAEYESSAGQMQNEMVKQANSYVSASGGGVSAGVQTGKMFKGSAASAASLSNAAKAAGTPEAYGSAASACSTAAQMASLSAGAYSSGGNAGGAAAMYGEEAKQYRSAAEQSRSQASKLGEQISSISGANKNDPSLPGLYKQQQECLNKANDFEKSAAAADAKQQAANVQAASARSTAHTAYSEAKASRSNPSACARASGRAASSFAEAGDLRSAALMNQQESVAYMQVAGKSGQPADYERAASAAEASAGHYSEIGDSRMAAQMYNRAAEMRSRAGQSDAADAMRAKSTDAADAGRMNSAAAVRTGQALSRMSSLGGSGSSAGAAPGSGSSVGAVASGGSQTAGRVSAPQQSAGGQVSAPQMQRQGGAQVQQPAQAGKAGASRSGAAPLPPNVQQARSTAYKNAVNVRDANAAVSGGAQVQKGGQSVLIQTSSGAARVSVPNAQNVQAAMANLPAHLRPKMGDMMQAEAGYQSAKSGAEQKRYANQYHASLTGMGYSKKAADLMTQRMKVSNELNQTSDPAKREQLRKELNELNGQVAERVAYEASPQYAEYQRRSAHAEERRQAYKKADRLRKAAKIISWLTDDTQARRRFGVGTPNEVTMGGMYHPGMYQQGVPPMMPPMGYDQQRPQKPKQGAPKPDYNKMVERDMQQTYGSDDSGSSGQPWL